MKEQHKKLKAADGDHMDGTLTLQEYMKLQAEHHKRQNEDKALEAKVADNAGKLNRMLELLEKK
jgi:hypothetical protein